MSPTETLLVTRPEPGVLLVTLDRPARLNAMTVQMFDELEQLAIDLRHDADLRVVLLAGAGRAFCAGYDLDEADELAQLSARQMLARQEHGARALEALRAIPQPLIAAVDGAAAGGGFALALAACIRLASPEARFNAAMVRIGMSAGDLGISWLLPRLVSPGIAAEIMYTGRFVEAAEAERIGLVSRIVPSASLLEECLTLARTIAANSPFGVQLTKRALHANLDGLPLRAAMELENRGQALATRGTDMPEALGAFKAKRTPQFTGA
ncbi:MAG: putative enoyl-CoA hydratase echA12 [Solirubrobacterales bacterium]|nr:putative enoyl-CoA hydratase echA12 [Solirubrobacterales bacterium]